MLLHGQTISGTVFERDSDIPVEYVGIGIVGKNIGTVSDQKGMYTLQISTEYHDDTLKFSCIGYHSYSVKVSDFLKLNNGNVTLKKRVYELTELIVRPHKIKQKELGITANNKANWTGFIDTRGFECGMLIRNQNTVFIKEINFNIAIFTYDTVLFRINIYKSYNNMQFENILSSPIYVSLSKQDIKDKTTIDIRHLNLVLKGDFLVAIEYINFIGSGEICFCRSPNPFLKHYIRQVSQGTWKEQPTGLSFYVLVDIER